MEEKPRQLFYLKRQPPHDGQNLIIPFKREEVVIGRSPDSHYMITNQCISRKHAVFIKNGDVWTVRNLSLNGVFINGTLIPKDEEQTISVGSMIQIGQPDIYVYRFGMKLASGKSRQSSTQNNTNPHLTQERDTLNARLQENDIRYQKLVDTKNQLQEELDLEKQQMNEKYETDRKKLEEKYTEGSMAQQAMLAEKQELAAKLEKEVVMLQSKLESERNTLEEQLAKEEHQREELLQSKDEVMKQLNAEKADLERRLEEERNRLEDQRRATEDYKKELQEQMDAKEELIQRKEEELSEAEQNREQIAKQQEEIKQRLQEQLDEVSLKFQEKDTENSILDKELKNKEEQLKQEMHSLEEAMERRMKEAVEAKETEIQQDAQKQLKSLKDEQNELQAKLLQAQETDRHQLDEMRNALDTLEAQKMSLEQELESSAVASQLARKEVVESVCDVMENEFQCPICSELFMTAILLNCGHTFCKFCIDTWKKNKRDCPNCRQKITSENRSVVVDNFISKIVVTLSEEIRNRREEILKERKDEEAQAAAAVAAAAEQAASRAAQRGGRRGRGRGRGRSVPSAIQRPPAPASVPAPVPTAGSLALNHQHIILPTAQGPGTASNIRPNPGNIPHPPRPATILYIRPNTGGNVIRMPVLRPAFGDGNVIRIILPGNRPAVGSITNTNLNLNLAQQRYSNPAVVTIAGNSATNLVNAAGSSNPHVIDLASPRPTVINNASSRNTRRPSGNPPIINLVNDTARNIVNITSTGGVGATVDNPIVISAGRPSQVHTQLPLPGTEQPRATARPPLPGRRGHWATGCPDL